MKLTFAARGKQIMVHVRGQRPQQVADACDERAAVYIAKALNLFENEAVDFPEAGGYQSSRS